MFGLSLRYTLLIGGFCLLLPGLLLLPRLFPPLTVSDHIDGFDTWTPTPQMIREELGMSNGAPSPTTVGGGRRLSDEERRKLFTQEFQRRFRSHNQAVGVKFVSSRLRISFASVVPRWDMARVSLQLYREARDLFGKNYVVDIYESNISMPVRKLGETRSRPAGDGEIVYFSPQYDKSNMLGEQPWNPIPLPFHYRTDTYLNPDNWKNGSWKFHVRRVQRMQGGMGQPMVAPGGATRPQ